MNFTKFNGGPARPLEERFWEKVDVRGDDECWEWQASLHKDGYGNFRGTLAHIVSYKLKYGEFPKGLYVCHTCDNRACVNPKHLFLGTQADNMKDMVSKGRSPNNRGEHNPKAKFTEEDIVEVYRLYNGGMTQRNIAKRYGVSQQAVLWIVRGKSWRNVFEQYEHLR